MSVETVKPLAMPAGQIVSIRGACATLAPSDRLDRDADRGLDLGPEGMKEIQRRRAVVQTKCLRFAATIDPEEAKTLLAGPVASWLEKPPTEDQVTRHMLEVGLLVQSGPPGEAPDPHDPTKRIVIEPVLRSELGTPGRRACHSALLSFRGRSASSCASRLYDCAMTLARKLEHDGRKPSGESHPLIVGLIVQA